MDHAEPLRRRTILFVGAEAAYMWNFRRSLLQKFQTWGYRVLVAVPGGGIDPAVFEQAGAEFIDWPLRRAGLAPLEDFRHLRALWRVLRRERPDIVFAHTIKPVIYGLLLAWAARVPRRVAMIPGLGFTFIGGQGFRRKISGLVARLGYRVALSRATLVLLQNTDDRDTLTQLRALPSSVATAIVNGSGVDMERFRQTPLPQMPFTFLMVARLLLDKGVGEFVEAARIVKAQRADVRFVLVGSTDDNPAAVSPETLAAWRAEGFIELRGFRPDPRPEYAACHIYVLPSYREGTPRTTLEAMATGRAIITTDTAGCRETVRHGVNGLLVPVRDARALASAMLELASDLPRVREMGEASLQMCRRKYELGAVTEITAVLIEGLYDMGTV